MFMRTGRILVAAAAMVLLACATLPARDPGVAIKYAWPPGNYVLTTTSISETEFLFGDQPVKSRSNSKLVRELAVGDHNEQGEKRIVARVVKYAFREEGDASFGYDSELPTAGQDRDMVFVYGPLVGSPVEIMLDADDDVLEVTGLDRLWGKLAARATTEVQRGEIARAGIELGDKAVEHSLRRLETIVPWEAVVPGDRWIAGMRSDYPLIGELRQRYNCTLKGIEEESAEKRAIIAAEARYESTTPKPGRIQGREVTVSQVEAVEKSELRVDLATGICVVDERMLEVNATIETTDDKGGQHTVKTRGVDRVKTTLVPVRKTAP